MELMAFLLFCPVLTSPSAGDGTEGQDHDVPLQDLSDLRPVYRHV